MRRLADAREYLDGDLRDGRRLDGNLRDLRRINRIFGGSSLSIRALRALVEAAHEGGSGETTDLRVIDVGTGAADIPLALVRARGPWRSIDVTAVDSRPEIVAAARRVTPALARDHRVKLEVADGRGLPFGDGAFHVAHASLVLHHLEPLEAVVFLRELARVSRLGIVVNDLARGVASWVGTWLVLQALTRNPLTLHDGPLSVRRAYTRREAIDLLAAAGLRPIVELNGLGRHRWAIAANRR